MNPHTFGSCVTAVLRLCVVLGIAITTAAPLAAQQLPAPAAQALALPDATASAAAADARDWFGWKQWVEWSRATGDWNAVRSDLEARGLTVSAVGKTDVSRFRSHSGDPATVGRTLFTVDAEADMGALTRLPGARAFVQLQWHAGGNASQALGDTQVFSNIDTDGVPYLGEAWFEMQLGPKVRTKSGRIDGNSEFATIETAGDFLASALALTPTLDGMPAYPAPTAGALIAIEPNKRLTLKAGVFDSTPGEGQLFNWSERFSIVQAGSRWTWPSTSLGGHVQAAWFGRREESGTPIAGGFVAAEQQLWQGDRREAAAFVVFSRCTGSCAIGRHAGGGVTLTGAVRRRANDVTGLGATWIAPGAADGDTPDELALELFHRIAVTPALSVVPDVQWISQSTAGLLMRRRAVFTVRFQIEL